MKALAVIAVIEALAMIALMWIVWHQQLAINDLEQWAQAIDRYLENAEDNDDPNAENSIDDEQPSLTRKH